MSSWKLVSLLLFLLGALGSSCSRPPEAEQQRCRTVVAEILAIQEERNRRTTEMDEMLAAAERGEIPKEESIERSHSWRAKEGELGSRVNALYVEAETSGCL